MSEHLYQFGDKVLHTARPEWGVGSVVKVEEAIINSERAQRLSIRFPNAGLKCLIAGQSAGAELQRVRADEAQVGHLNGSGEAIAELEGPGKSRLEQWDHLSQSEWLSPLAQRKIRELMTAVPDDCTDAFIPLQKRLSNTFRLYRFDKSGRGLIDWAVAQTGMNDPLTRFTRTDLEQLFDRWAAERDSHLAKLLSAARDDNAAVREALQGAPPAAVQQVRKHLTASR